MINGVMYTIKYLHFLINIKPIPTNGKNRIGNNLGDPKFLRWS